MLISKISGVSAVFSVLNPLLLARCFVRPVKKGVLVFASDVAKAAVRVFLGY